MVFFTCNACGESLKKAQVEKHVINCRSCQVLSCIDCGKDFWGDDYKNHVKCISEDQKYGGKGFEAKANKGDVKQQQWLQKIHDALKKPDLSPSLRTVLNQVCAYDNVPRKKTKFQNWMKNSLKISNSSLHEQVWTILSPPEVAEAPEPSVEKELVTNGQQQNAEKKKLNKRERKEARRQKNGQKTSENMTQEPQEPEGVEEDEEVQRRKERKRKHREIHDVSKKTKIEEQTADTEETEKQEQVAPNDKFNWKGNIKAVLREAPDHEVSVKKLRKKILSAYYSFTGDRNFKSEEEILALFNKKIHKNPKFRVLKDRVKLIQ